METLSAKREIAELGEGIQYELRRRVFRPKRSIGRTFRAVNFTDNSYKVEYIMNYSASGIQTAIENQKTIATIIKERDALLNGKKQGFFMKLIGGRK